VNVLLLGSGGREHAMALAIAKSPLLDTLFAAPGNPGIAAVATLLAVDPEDHAAVIAACRANAVGLVVVGPEAPLVGGIVDGLEEAGITAFGPTKAAARLEGSKSFTKALCAARGIPTADFRCFETAVAARAYVSARGAPIVVKADGLASGKGVVVAATVDEAHDAIDRVFGGAFGAAGASVVIEDVLEGEEASFFALCDGHHAVAFASAQDHKRLEDGDRGPNTGGMGAYSPAPILDEAGEAAVMRAIIEPALAGMAEVGTPFKGVLFAGLMIAPDGPKLIEFNTRFGDPETQAMLPRLREDFLGLLLACAEGRMPPTRPRFAADAALTIVLAARGYPTAPKKGGAIEGLDAAGRGAIVTHAGTRLVEGQLVADGGRVLNITGLGATIAEARERAYAGAALVRWTDGVYRHDIGARALVARNTPSAHDDGAVDLV
jgi:phosphoribosylamine--glycine ligase